MDESKIINADNWLDAHFVVCEECEKDVYLPEAIHFGGVDFCENCFAAISFMFESKELNYED